MPQVNPKQNPDSRQGGEGTTRNPGANNPGALLKSLGRPGDNHEVVPPKESGTK